MKNSFLLFFFLTSAITVGAQDAGTTRVLAFYSKAMAHQGKSEFDSSIRYFHLAIAASNQTAASSVTAESYSGMGHSFMRKSVMDSARWYLNKGQQLAERIKDATVLAGIYINYGNVLLEEGSYQKSLEYFVQAARAYKNSPKNELNYCLALSNIGNVQYRLGNTDQALVYAAQSLEIAKRMKYTSSVGYAHKLRGRIFRKQKKYDSAVVEYEKGKKIFTTLGDKRSVAEIMTNVGNIYFDKERFADALAAYRESLQLARSIPSKSLMAFAYSSIGQALVTLNKNDEALKYLDSSRTLAQAIGNHYLVMDSYEAMSTVYEAKGSYKKALEAQHLFSLMKDSITQNENRTLAEETQAKYELEKKEAQISLLEKDRELKTLSLSRERAVQTGIALTLVSVIIIGLLLMNRYRIRARAKRQAEIERVRQTLARDLHDDIGSTLSTINIMSKLALHENPGNASIHLTRIAEQSSQMMESMTDMVWSINPANDAPEKAIVKMKVFAAEILEPKNIAYTFSGAETFRDVALPPEKRKNLFLIYKEALNNAAKYSNATRVAVSVVYVGKQLTLTIADNGSGFDSTSVKDGNGLKNMASRATAMNGSFELTTSPGKGTEVMVVFTA